MLHKNVENISFLLFYDIIWVLNVERLNVMNRIIMGVGQALTIAMSIAAFKGFTDTEQDQLRSYASMNAKQWVAAQKREDEVEAMIRAEADRISR